MENNLRMTCDRFKELYSLDIKKLTDEKGKFTYLSWSYAWQLLKEQDPEATFEYVMDATGERYEIPAGKGWIVRTTVTAFGMTLPMMLPVMNNTNQSVQTPDARHIGDSLMRCLVKNIAMFGIGLALYNGEDLEQFVKKSEIDEIREEVQGYLTEFKTNTAFADTYKGCLKTLGKPTDITDINMMRTFKDRLIDVLRVEKLIK